VYVWGVADYVIKVLPVSVKAIIESKTACSSSHVCGSLSVGQRSMSQECTFAPMSQ